MRTQAYFSGLRAFSNMAARLVAPGERDEEGGQRETGLNTPVLQFRLLKTENYDGDCLTLSIFPVTSKICQLDCFSMSWWKRA